MEKIYETIKTLRLKRGLSQEELAKKTGYTDRSSIAKIESGKVDLTNSKIEEFAKALGVTPGYLMGWRDESGELTRLPSNISLPAAYAVPILGTICCGDGTHAEQHYEGEFFVDRSIKADCALHVKGDSMIDAHIYDGDVAFLKKDYEYEDGKIYGCVYGAEESASLKKVFRADGKLILQPCNASYKALVEDPDDVYIVGELAGVYHPVK